MECGNASNLETRSFQDAIEHLKCVSFWKCDWTVVLRCEWTLWSVNYNHFRCPIKYTKSYCYLSYSFNIQLSSSRLDSVFGVRTSSMANRTAIVEIRFIFKTRLIVEMRLIWEFDGHFKRVSFQKCDSSENAAHLEMRWNAANFGNTFGFKNARHYGDSFHFRNAIGWGMHFILRYDGMREIPFILKTQL